MRVLRYIALVGLALWTGGLAALGGVGAPTIFRVLEARDAAHGRELAGVLFGAIFQLFQYASWGIALVLLGSLGVRAALGPRPRRFAVRMWTVLLMLALSLVTALVLTPRIETLRDSVTGSIASLPAADPRAIEFGRLHGASSVLMLATLLLGLGLIWAEMEDRH